MSGSSKDKYRADGSYRPPAGAALLSTLRELAGRIDAAALSRSDSMALHAAVSLLGNIERRQAGYEPRTLARPAQWTVGEYGRITDGAA